MYFLFTLLFACSTDNTDSASDDTDTNATATDCETTPLDECTANDCTLLSGLPVTQDANGNDCVDWNGTPQPLGCSSYDASTAVISFAQDPDGACWAFPSGTIPAGWSHCDPVSECE